jgi:hypothetical protein
MNAHSIFYYPYASFTGGQAKLMKVAAIYFDKLYLLDPEKSSSETIGIQDPGVAKDVSLLEHKDVGILERVAPEDVVAKYHAAISKAVRDDMKDNEFVQHCLTSEKKYWTIALAKIPKDIRNDPTFQPKDEAMRHLLNDVPRDAADEAGRYYDETYIERIHPVYSEQFVYDETITGPGKEMEYRYADYPVEFGESIMMNHALFAGLLHSNATPLTDNTFHNKALEIKFRRIRQIPELARLLDDNARADKIRQDLLVHQIVTDKQLQLPIIKPDQPLESILEYREKNDDILAATRNELAWMAREIKENPWSEEFGEEVYRNIIPKKIRPLLEENKKARNGWLKASGLGLSFAAATAGLFINSVPFLSVPMLIGVMALAGDQVIPNIEELINWKAHRKSNQVNGLHYLLDYKPA